MSDYATRDEGPGPKVEIKFLHLKSRGTNELSAAQVFFRSSLSRVGIRMLVHFSNLTILLCSDPIVYLNCLRHFNPFRDLLLCLGNVWARGEIQSISFGFRFRVRSLVPPFLSWL